MSKTNNYLSLGYQTNLDGEKYNLRDYRHAARLYADDHQVRAPKYGFLYYVKFEINQRAVVGTLDKNIGVYVKKIDLPKFTVQTEMVNQYNRKTQINTKLTYNPITIEFHDDNADITNDLWYSYYQNLIADGNYGSGSSNIPRQFTDTKYGPTDYEYGMYDNKVSESFLERIDIYMMHHTLQDHTKISLINPKISEWRHDTAGQSDSTKMMQNSMTIVYENVLYSKGIDNSKLEGFVNEFYDPGQSPVKIGGNPENDPGYNKNTDVRPGNAAIFNQPPGTAYFRPGNASTNPNRPSGTAYPRPGNAAARANQPPGTNYPRPVNAAAGIQPPGTAYFRPNNRIQDNGGRVSSRQVNDQTFDVRRNAQYGLINPPNLGNNPFLDIAGILASNYLQRNGLGRVGPVGYTIASSALQAATHSGAGKYYDPPSTQAVPGLFQLPGGVGINIFKGFNTSVDGRLRLNPAAVVFSPRR